MITPSDKGSGISVEEALDIVVAAVGGCGDGGARLIAWFFPAVMIIVIAGLLEVGKCIIVD